MRNLAILGLALVLVGCGGTPEPEPEKVVEPNTTESKVAVAESVKNTASKTTGMNAEAMVNGFKDSGLSVGEIVVYDETTDPNKLLNRPNQYTQKVSFADTSIEQPDPEFLLEGAEPFKGGTIEVFPNKELAQSRKKYVETVTADAPMLQQYIYINGTAVLRLEHEILPSDAEKYQTIFMEK